MDAAEAFLLGLVPLLSNLGRLRHLTVCVRYDMKIRNEFSRHLVSSHPFLESLTLFGFTAANGREMGDGSLGFNLSKLKCLSLLHLDYVVNIDRGWCLHDWPSTITDLSISRCGVLTPSSAHHIIHHLAPCLRKLKLEFEFVSIDHRGIWDESWEERWKVESSSSLERRFCLPFPTGLTLLTDIETMQDAERYHA